MLCVEMILILCKLWIGSNYDFFAEKPSDCNIWFPLITFGDLKQE